MRTGLSVLRNLAVFGLALLVCSLMIPRPLPGLNKTVNRLFLREKDEIQLIFAGSSNVRMIDRNRFEAEAGKLGVHVRAFNLGVYGMWPQETEIFLRAVLRQRLPRLRYIVLELRPWKTSYRVRYLNPIEPENSSQARRMEDFQRGMRSLMDTTDRDLWWHTPRATMRMLRVGLKTRAPAEIQRGHLKLGLQRTLPLGLGLSFLDPGAERRRDEETEALLNAADGPAEPSDQRAEPAQMPRETYEGLLRRMDEVDENWDRQLTAAWLRGQLRSLRARGYQVFCLYPPIVEPGSLTNARELEALLPGEEIWNFADPSEHPELFVFENRLEQIHLNRSGNEIYARLLAAKFAEWIARQRAGAA